MTIPTDLHVQFTSPLDDQLLFHRMETEAEPGRSVSCNLTLSSARGDLELGDLVGQVVMVELDHPDTTPNDAIRCFNGCVTQVSRQGAHRKYHVYSAIGRPWLRLLGQAGEKKRPRPHG
jgi:type VI secretion system secreted protein VgrG